MPSLSKAVFSLSCSISAQGAVPASMVFVRRPGVGGLVPVRNRRLLPQALRM